MKIISMSPRSQLPACMLLATSTVINSQSLADTTQQSLFDSTTSEPFKACAVPSFDWATYSTSSTSRMYGMRGAIDNGSLFAAGYVKSTIDASTAEGIATTGKFALTGPYSIGDPTGTNAKTVTADLQSYTTLQGAKENAGGTWGQYEVGVVKMNALTGEPEDVFVWEGHGLDETTGLAAKNGVLALSGHFTGNLTAVLADGSSATIWNSNVEVGGVADNADQFHPNTKDVSGHSGVDDGFVIRASGSTGATDWIVRYPESNKDAQIIDVDIDSDGNVFGAGYKCTQLEGAESKVCDGVIVMLAASDGSVLWEKILGQLGAAIRMKFDEEDGSLYVTGTTTFSGLATKDPKTNPVCEHETCSVVMRLSAIDGAVHWERTLQGSPRWGVFGQNGGVGLANKADGPYVYVAIDDTGEEAATSLDAGTAYSGCKAADGVITPEYEILQDRVVTADDCAEGSAFVARDADDALLASTAGSGVSCGDAEVGSSCLMKYHKYTGLPIWSHDAPDVSGLVPSADGTSVHIGGWYSSRGGIPSFGSVKMSEYLREQGLDGKTGGIFNAKINAVTGLGEYAISSGGGSKDRLNDMVGDAEGNIYNIGYHQNLIFRWGNNLKTTMIEDEGKSAPNSDNPTQAIDTQICVSKMAASIETVPSCLTQCNGNTDTAIIADDSCFIDGKCYGAGESTNAFGKACYTCDPSVSKREWTQGSAVGTTDCFIKGTCVKSGEMYFYQRRAWNSPRIFSECLMCDPARNPNEWSVKAGFAFNETNLIPPNDCNAIIDEGNQESSNVEAVSQSDSTSSDVASSDVASSNIESSKSASSDIEYMKIPSIDSASSDTTSSDTASVSEAAPSSSESASSNSGTSDGTIAGIVLGILAAVAIFGAAAFKLSKRKKEIEKEGPYNENVPDDKSSIVSAV